MPQDFEKLRQLAQSHGQGHVLAFYDSLAKNQKEKLLGQIAQVDFSLLDRLIGQFIRNPKPAEQGGELTPAPVITLPDRPEQQKAEQAARAAGEAALRAGRVGCFLVAGGQGTRLGLRGPKGQFSIGPLTGHTLFQLHAEKIMALRKRYGAQVPWLIMTSDANHEQTKEFLFQNDYFNLGAETVVIFKQANMPALGRDGKILMQAPGEIALSPNGHGGSIKALHDSGALGWLKQKGVDTLFYFQVDNVLTKIGDPVFIGHHLQAKAEMSSKVCRKRDWREKVGVLGLRNGRLAVIEYSDLPDAVAKETDAQGKLKWWAGSIAIHVLDTAFMERLNKGGFQLPYHKAEKNVPCLGPDGQPAALKQDEKNGLKFETFVFDALSQAKSSVTLETRREEDFSPVKNAAGEDSPQTAWRDLMELYARWLAAAGTKVPRKPDGSLDCEIEISPLTSLEGENLAGKAPKIIQSGSKVEL